jgi:hypothetical protein
MSKPSNNSDGWIPLRQESKGLLGTANAEPENNPINRVIWQQYRVIKSIKLGAGGNKLTSPQHITQKH